MRLEKGQSIRGSEFRHFGNGPFQGPCQVRNGTGGPRRNIQGMMNIGFRQQSIPRHRSYRVSSLSSCLFRGAHVVIDNVAESKVQEWWTRSLWWRWWRCSIPCLGMCLPSLLFLFAVIRTFAKESCFPLQQGFHVMGRSGEGMHRHGGWHHHESTLIVEFISRRCVSLSST